LCFSSYVWCRSQYSNIARRLSSNGILGIQPYCSEFSGNCLRDQLLKHPDISTTPNWDGINDYFTFQFCLGEKTLFQGINKLLPGNFIIFDPNTPGSFHVQKYWDVNYTIDSHHTEEYFVHTLTRLLEDLVRLQLRSDFPVGAHLSGGVD
jgi:asparagine synthase (glutamine-hydrolysing)